LASEEEEKDMFDETDIKEAVRDGVIEAHNVINESKRIS